MGYEYNHEQQFYAEAYSDNETRRERGYGWEDQPSQSMKQLLQRNELVPTTNKTAIDLGIGDGRNATYLQAQGYNIIGVDFTFEALIEARHTLGKQATLIQQDLTQPNALSNLRPADLVLDWSVMDHIRPNDLQTYTNNVINAVWEGGHLLTTQFNYDMPGLPKGQDYKVEDNHYSKAYSLNELRQTLQPLTLVDHIADITSEDNINNMPFNAALFYKEEA